MAGPDPTAAGGHRHAARSPPLVDHDGPVRLLPVSRSRRITLAGLTVVVVASAPRWVPAFEDVIDRVLPERAHNRAAERTSEEAAVGAALAPPEAVGATDPTGTDPAVRLREIARLAAPTSVVDLPGPGATLVTTVDGIVHSLDLATGEHDVVLDLSGLVSTGGERGLLGAAADPDGGRLYLDYTNRSGDTEIRSWPLDAGRPRGAAADGVLHLTIGQPFANHNGGHLAFGPDGALWIGTGDGGAGGDPADVAQDVDSLLGKMLRVVPLPGGGIEAPATNPAWGGRPEVWAIGLRNPWRYTFDRETNRLWIADVGQDRVEEVSVIEPDAGDANFGWNEVEGDEPFEGQAHPGFTAPVVTYTHPDGCSITGGYVYRGSSIPGLYGWYLFGDYCGGWIRAVPADDPGTEPVAVAADLGPVISFAELDDGELLVLTGSGISAIEAA